jgi:hypothetical protein
MCDRQIKKDRTLRVDLSHSNARLEASHGMIQIPFMTADGRGITITLTDGDTFAQLVTNIRNIANWADRQYGGEARLLMGIDCECRAIQAETGSVGLIELSESATTARPRAAP